MSNTLKEVRSDHLPSKSIPQIEQQVTRPWGCFMSGKLQELARLVSDVKKVACGQMCRALEIIIIRTLAFT